MKDEQTIKMAIIAGASTALKYKSQDYKATDQEILQKVTQDMKDILSNIDRNN
jgi:hypothetical protein